MSRLLTKEIVQSDIEEYLSDYADFSFELRVLKELNDLGLHCKHSGTYDDPLTGKSREFDIRALLDKHSKRFHLSVECKNIQNHYPLVMHCLKRSLNESYNEVIHTFEPPPKKVGSFTLAGPDILKEFCKSIRFEGKQSLYKESEYVAKSSDQVGRHINNTITASDGGVFEKISQAINSAKDLIYEARNLDTKGGKSYITVVCPVLVVPDSVLWQVNYSDDGAMVGSPNQVNHVSYYIGKDWTLRTLPALSYTLSHLEIITFSQIKPLIENYFGSYSIFSKEEST